jgi:hypothetical protein
MPSKISVKSLISPRKHMAEVTGAGNGLINDTDAGACANADVTYDPLKDKYGDDER